MKKADFPDDFLWGTSTSSHQIEGGNHNQWSEWELANAERLAKEAPKLWGWLPNWPEISDKLAKPENYISGDAVGHYKHFEEDFDIIKKLNMNAFRFGIEWSRIEPEPGKWNKEAITHYHKVFAELRKRNIEPLPTLWHWAMPVWFTEMGAFEKRANIAYFVRFAEKCVQEFGEGLKYLITLNEPNVYAGFSYGNGLWPPGRKNIPLGLRVFRNLATAHNQVYDAVKRTYPHLQIAVADHMAESRAISPRNPMTRLVISAKDYTFSWWFQDRIRHHQDFIGVNFYFTDYHRWYYKTKNPSTPLSDFGWYMEPSAIHPLLVKVWKRYKKPIIITENGLADSNDAHRKWWIDETIKAMRLALDDGVPLKGYLYWSLLDNFEWSAGWWPEFGLVSVDRTTMKRTIRPSAKWFAEQIAKMR